MAVHVQSHNSWRTDSKHGEDDVSKFGYKKQLNRTLNLFSTFGLAFSYISPVVGVYTLFSTGICTSGPSYIWGLPVVVFGQMMVALVFSELSVVYPLAGALYQWARRLVGYRYGWFVGWIYGWALIVTIASIDLGAAPYIIDVLGIQSEPWIVVLLALLVSVIHSVINISGVKVTAVITNLGLIVEIGMTVVLGGIILFGPGPHQPISTLISRESYFYDSGIAPPLMFLPALLSQAWIFFGFESAADVSEEIVDAKKSVPRAILLSLTGASLVTAFLEVALVLGIPHLSKITDPLVCSSNGAIPIIIEAHLGNTVSRVLSLLLIIAYLSSAGAVQAAASRLLFSFARDDQVPFSETLKYVHPSTKVPTNATILLAIVPIVIILTNFIQLSDGISMELVVTNYAVIGIYSAFMLIVIGRLYAYFKKDFKSSDDNRYFSLRAFSIPVAITALVYQVAMITNLLWPRPANVIVGWLGIFITLAIFGIGMAITLFWVRNKANKEESSLLIHY